ncbi:hypothetical protein JOE65_002893 [Arthrobacter roseus]|nr:hypothetical protein [Arthrobacter roseus]
MTLAAVWSWGRLTMIPYWVFCSLRVIITETEPTPTT